MKNEYLTIKEVAEKLGISVQTVYKRIKLDFKPYLKEFKGQKRLNSAVLKHFHSTNFKPNSTDFKPSLNLGLKDNNTQNNVIEVEQTYQELFTLYMEAKDTVNNLEQRIFNLELIVSSKQGEINSLEKELNYLREELAKERNFSREQGKTIMVLADQSQKLQLAQMNSPALVLEENTSEQEQTKKRWQFWK